MRPERPKTENEKLVPVILVLSLLAVPAMMALYVWLLNPAATWLREQVQRAFPH